MLLPPFIQKRINYKDRLRACLNPAEYNLIDTISDFILKTKQGRITFTGEFSCRFLMNFLKLSYSYISKLLKRLIAKGFLEIVKKGHAGYGTVYKIVMQEEEVIELREKKPNNSCCVLQETNSYNHVNNDYHDFSKNFSRAVNIAKNILKKKKIKEPEPILNRIKEFINLQGGKILDPCKYIVGACKREPEVKPEPKHYFTEEETKKRLARQEQQEPVRLKAEMPEPKPEELDLHPGEPGQESQRNYLAELDLIKASYPEKVREIDFYFKREIGRTWLFTVDIEKAKKIVERFIEINS